MRDDPKALELIAFQVLTHNEPSKWKSPTYYSLEVLLVPLNFCGTNIKGIDVARDNISQPKVLLAIKGNIKGSCFNNRMSDIDVLRQMNKHSC